MPEGPEIFIRAAELRPKLVGKKLMTIKNPDSKTTSVNAIVKEIGTKGKKLWFELDNGMYVLFSFALEGEIVMYGEVQPKRLIGEFIFEDGCKCSFTDHMKYAKFVYCNEEKFRDSLPQGVDPLHELYGMREWISICQDNGNKLIAKFVYDQSIIAGIGNMYRSEVLHAANIDPTAKLKNIDDASLEKLLIAIYRILGAAAKGNYTMQVHGKSFDPNGNAVKKVKVAPKLYVWSTITPTVPVKCRVSPRKKSSDVYVDNGNESASERSDNDL